MREQTLSLLLRNCSRIVLFVFLIVLFGNSVSGYEFGVSPGIINLNLNIGQERCSSFRVFADGQSFFVSDRWGKLKTNDVTEYNLNSSDVGLNIEYLDNFFVSDEREIRVCFSSSFSKIYHGVLLIEPYKKNAEIGIWVNLNVGDSVEVKGVSDTSDRLTGQVIKEDINGDYSPDSAQVGYSEILFLELDFMFIMCLILFLLFLKLRKRREEERQYF